MRYRLELELWDTIDPFHRRCRWIRQGSFQDRLADLMIAMIGSDRPTFSAPALLYISATDGETLGVEEKRSSDEVRARRGTVVDRALDVKRRLISCARQLTTVSARILTGAWILASRSVDNHSFDSFAFLDHVVKSTLLVVTSAPPYRTLKLPDSPGLERAGLADPSA